MDDDLDLESRANRFTSAMEGISDLLSSCDQANTIQPWNVGALMAMMAAEAHVLFDVRYGPRIPKNAND